jgi:isochorismate synthase
MANALEVFKALELQYKNNLPFVLYNRPIQSTVKCWLQKNDVLHTTSEFNEAGFVFAPFNLKTSATILFPKEASEYLETEDEVEFEVEDENEIEINSKKGKQKHIDLVSKGIESIKNEDLEKVVVSRYETHQLSNFNPIETFKKLYNTYKNAMVYCWYHPKVGLWLGATPELLFKIEGQQLTTISLAGTQAYQDNDIVKWPDKELTEQQIVTDYLTTQIAPFAIETKTSQVETVRAGNLLHLKTRLVSRLKTNTQLKAIIEALHPTPAVCGFPKEGAKNFILKNENYAREFYTGFLGELNLKQNKTRNTNQHNIKNNAYARVKTQSNFYVNLRCIQIKNEQAFIYVGGGITRDSVAENEWNETVNKTKTMLRVLI